MMQKPGGGGLAGLLSSDAKKALADQMAIVSVQLPSQSVREAMFLLEYLGREAGEQFLADLMMFKVHQTPFAFGRYVQAIKALALEEFMSRININLGGK